mgnify:CR=1 FL=1
MKLIIAGSRSITYYPTVSYHIERFSWYSAITEIVSGTASGVDTLGERYATEHNIPIKQFPADWTMYGKSAGIRRNEIMGDYADRLLLFWDGQSPGSRHMMMYMAKIKKPFNVIMVK